MNIFMADLQSRLPAVEKVGKACHSDEYSRKTRGSNEKERKKKNVTAGTNVGIPGWRGPALH